MRLEAQIGGGLRHVQPRGQARQVQQFFQFVVHRLRFVSASNVAEIRRAKVYVIHEIIPSTIFSLAEFTATEDQALIKIDFSIQNNFLVGQHLSYPFWQTFRVNCEQQIIALADGGCYRLQRVGKMAGNIK